MGQLICRLKVQKPKISSSENNLSKTVYIPGIVRRSFAGLSETSPWESKQFCLGFLTSNGDAFLR